MKNFLKWAAIIIGLAMLYFAYQAYQAEQKISGEAASFVKSLFGAPAALWKSITNFFSGGSSSSGTSNQTSTALAQSIGVNTSTPQGQQVVNDLNAASVDPALSTTGTGLEPGGPFVWDTVGASDPFSGLAAGGGSIDPTNASTSYNLLQSSQ